MCKTKRLKASSSSHIRCSCTGTEWKEKKRDTTKEYKAFDLLVEWEDSRTTTVTESLVGKEKRKEFKVTGTTWIRYTSTGTGIAKEKCMLAVTATVLRTYGKWL